MENIKISGVVITFNEAKNIARSLQSMYSVCDELIVVDSGSTDNTIEICKKMGAIVVVQEFLGYTKQKNFAINQASNNFVLSLDADEVLSDELKKSINNIRKRWTHDGYEMSRLTNYCGKWIRHCGWYPDRKIRLFDRRKAYWVGGDLHEKMTMKKNATCKRIKGDILHYSYYTINDHIQQIDKFTKISSQELFKKNIKPSIFKVYTSVPVKFIRDYFLKLGILDGYFGFRIAVLSAYATFLKYARAKELFDKKDKSDI